MKLNGGCDALGEYRDVQRVRGIRGREELRIPGITPQHRRVCSSSGQGVSHNSYMVLTRRDGEYHCAVTTHVFRRRCVHP